MRVQPTHVIEVKRVWKGMIWEKRKGRAVYLIGYRERDRDEVTGW